MKKFLFLITVLSCLVLSSAVLAEDIPNHYCQVDDYGCYVLDDENHSSYLMFWSEAGRRAVMGDLTAPNENVVSKPGQDAVVKSNLLPLLAPAATAAAEDPVATPTVCGRAQFEADFLLHNSSYSKLPVDWTNPDMCDLDMMIVDYCANPSAYDHSFWEDDFGCTPYCQAV